MYDDFSRTRLVREAWKATTDKTFSELELARAAVTLAERKHWLKLTEVLPVVWLKLDHQAGSADWLAATGLDGEAIDAINAALGAGLPPPGKKARLHEYSLRPQDFPALLYLAFIAARLATPYMGGGPHRKVRDQFWYVPELAVIVMRCLPPKLDLLVVEHILRKLLQTPIGEAELIDHLMGLPISPSHYVGESPPAGDIMGLIAEDEEDDDKA